jgi:small GTP-binding protein
MTPMYYRGAKAAICVFDVTNEDSFSRVASWLKDLKAHADPNVVICIAGNKCDRSSSFDINKANELAISNNGLFFRTSAMTGEGVEQLFETLSRNIAETYAKNKRQISKDNNAIKLGEHNKKSDNTSSSGCC